jgi:hypothetical protein
MEVSAYNTDSGVLWIPDFRIGAIFSVGLDRFCDDSEIVKSKGGTDEKACACCSVLVGLFSDGAGAGYACR